MQELEKDDPSKVMVVDNDPIILRLLTNYLTSVGFKVFPITHGQHMFELLERQKPDVILLDILMPQMDGFEVCQRLKHAQHTHDIPVIFMSALTGTLDKVKGFQMGAVDYITKPLQLEEVRARLQTHLIIQRLQRRLQEQNTLLAKQKIRFERLADATFEGIAILDDGMIFEANTALLTLYGYKRNEIVGKPFVDLIKHSERGAANQVMLTENNAPYETCGVKKDGTLFFFEMQSKLMPYQERHVQVIAIRDLTLQRAMEQKTARLERENIELRANIKERYRFGEIIGKSAPMQNIYEYILNAAASDAHVAVYGESGTGKELIARTIHDNSVRHAREFVVVNCGAIPDSLFESEFFGYRKGAFTGAERDKPGFFDLAHQGTLFLDEVGELTPLEQVKLLRAIETGEYTPLGWNRSKSADVRIIVATHRNITGLRKQGRLRDDFFYRIHVISITVPPLRERRGDIPLLLEHFIEQHSGQKHRGLPGKIVDIMYAHDWPGNVRELRNVVSRYLAGQPLDLDRANPGMLPEPGEQAGQEFIGTVQALRSTVEQFERQCIIHALNENQWHREHTAQALDLPIRTLHRKMKNLSISRKNKG